MLTDSGLERRCNSPNVTVPDGTPQDAPGFLPVFLPAVSHRSA
ncbi:hypothetical protein [Thermobifida halotolerans]|nr:hypothetical protein [Thermobifida halotolerans]